MGKLFVVATPIGNLSDISQRALDTLRSVDLIVCEDTRVTSILLNKFEIKKPLVAINEYNEEQMIFSILKKLESCDIALVSDAGTPLISDPGYKLTKLAKNKGFMLVPIPGASAITASLSVSCLPTDKFIFLGFLPKTPSKAENLLESTKGFEITVVLYESPHRILQTLKTIQKVFGDIKVTLARELTKKFEDINEKTISKHLLYYLDKNPKGEFVILFSTKKDL